MNKRETTPTQIGKATAEQQYAAPAIEVIEIEIEQNILGGSTDNLPDVPGEAW